MLDNIEIMKPSDIEKRSFEIIRAGLNCRSVDPRFLPILMRVIHTTADFEYADTLKYSENIMEIAEKLLKNGCTIVTDTEMAKAGINKRILSEHGIDVKCFIADGEVMRQAKNEGRTRASVAAERAMELEGSVIFVCGNAPTALMALANMKKRPDMVIGVPVGFVNVVESKELVKTFRVPYIISEGRKGGSNVAAAIVNAIVYHTFPRGE